jgi:hypothetical protein
MASFNVTLCSDYLIIPELALSPLLRQASWVTLAAEHWPRHPEIEGSNEAAATGRVFKRPKK